MLRHPFQFSRAPLFQLDRLRERVLEIAARDEFFQWVISQVAEAGKDLEDLHKQIALLHRDIDVRRALQTGFSLISKGWLI